MSHVFVLNNHDAFLVNPDFGVIVIRYSAQEKKDFYYKAEYLVGWPNHVAICRSGLQYI